MSFATLDIALRALSAQQSAISVLNHNIANANTPGYSRQRAIMAASPAFLVPTFSGLMSRSQVGTGVEIKSIDRIRDLFIDAQIQKENGALMDAAIRQDTFDKLQIIFNEPSNTGLNNLFSRFWETWQDLTSDPRDLSSRAAVIQQGLALTNMLNRDYVQIADVRADLHRQAALKVDDVNAIAEKLAQLNGQIQRAQLGGQKPNDLLDQREVLLEQLSGLVKFNSVVNDDNSVSVFVSDQELVNRTDYRTMTTSVDVGFQLTIEWADNAMVVDPGSGELKGIQDSANTVITAQLAQLDALAVKIRDEVNALHQTGFDLAGTTGVAFFAGTGARDITVAGALQADATLLAAAGQPNASGDSTVALAIAQLQHITTDVDALSEVSTGVALPTAGIIIQRLTAPTATAGITYTLTSPGAGQLTLSAVIGGTPVTQTVSVADMTAAGDQTLDFTSLGIRIALRGTGPGATAANIITDLTAGATDQITVASRVTVDDTYQQNIAALGIDARSIDATVANEAALVGSLQRRRESISGVSLDEEAANLIRYQRAYEAAARVITVADEMIQVLIRMGR